MIETHELTQKSKMIDRSQHLGYIFWDVNPNYCQSLNIVKNQFRSKIETNHKTNLKKERENQS